MTTAQALWHQRFKDPVSGLSHLAGFLISLFAGGLLVGATRGGLAAHAVSVVFAVSTALLYLASSVYHLAMVAAPVERRLRVLDRAAIFLMIAGTSTPFFHYAFSGTTRTVMLAVIWGLAALGVAFKLLWHDAPRFLYVAIYLGMGWMAVVRLDDTIAGLGPVALSWLLAGGLAYTVGALVYALKRPNLSLHFGFHELWHMFVLAGTACHYVGIYGLSTS